MQSKVDYYLYFLYMESNIASVFFFNSPLYIVHTQFTVNYFSKMFL